MDASAKVRRPDSRLLDEYRGRQGTFFYSGNAGRPVAAVRDRDPETEAAAAAAEARGMEACGYDPVVRVRFQEEADIEAEVMNPTRVLGIMRNPDVEVVQACTQVYNDWAAAFVSCNPKRFIGVSVIPMNDVDWAVTELARTLKQGLLNPMINCQAPEGCPLHRDPIYDGFWAAASEAAAPVTLPLLTGWVLSPLGGAQEQTPEERHANPAKWIELFAEIQTVLANDFIFGGVLERFPTLQLVCSEYEVSWIPGFVARLDQIDDNISRFHLPRLRMRASDYMRTRVYHGFISDTAADHSIPHIGVEQVLWGSDFPHFRSIGLEAQAALHKLLGTLPREGVPPRLRSADVHTLQGQASGGSSALPHASSSCKRPSARLCDPGGRQLGWGWGVLYNASKHAAVGSSRQLAAELAPRFG